MLSIKQVLSILSGSIAIGAGIGLSIKSHAQSQSIPTPPTSSTQLPTVTNGSSGGVDFDRLTFSDLKFTQSGAGAGMSWQAGQSLDTVITAGMAGIQGVSDLDLDKKISQVPGLSNTPLSKLFKMGSYFPFAIFDMSMGKEEHNAKYKPITGSEQVGFNYPCPGKHEKKKSRRCSYINLADYRGSLLPLIGNVPLLGDKASMPYHGAKWIKGGEEKEGGQMVPGGRGLGKGLEPTGRPLGFWFKLVLVDTNESEGTATFSLFTRACDKAKINCTPFIIGPLGEFTVTETGPVFLGTPDHNNKKGVPGKGDIAVPKALQDKANALSLAKGFRTDVAGGSGQSQDQQAQDCADKALKLVDPSIQSAASNAIPQIISQGMQANLNGNQISLLIAIAEDTGFSESPSSIVQNNLSRVKSLVTDKVVNYQGVGNSKVSNRASTYQTVLKQCISSGCSATSYRRPTDGPVTSTYGWRIHPTLGTRKFHSGVDFGDPHGTPIRAINCGKVVHAGSLGGYGNTVIVEHPNKLFSLSAHASELSVSVGQTVESGQTIARVGSTGMSTGPHLHLTLTRPDQYKHFDPATVIPGI